MDTYSLTSFPSSIDPVYTIGTASSDGNSLITFATLFTDNCAIIVNGTNVFSFIMDNQVLTLIVVRGQPDVIFYGQDSGYIGYLEIISSSQFPYIESPDIVLSYGENNFGNNNTFGMYGINGMSVFNMEKNKYICYTNSSQISTATISGNGGYFVYVNEVELTPTLYMAPISTYELPPTCETLEGTEILMVFNNSVSQIIVNDDASFIAGYGGNSYWTYNSFLGPEFYNIEEIVDFYLLTINYLLYSNSTHLFKVQSNFVDIDIIELEENLNGNNQYSTYLDTIANMFYYTSNSNFIYKVNLTTMIVQSEYFDCSMSSIPPSFGNRLENYIFLQCNYNLYILDVDSMETVTSFQITYRQNDPITALTVDDVFIVFDSYDVITLSKNNFTIIDEYSTEFSITLSPNAINNSIYVTDYSIFSTLK